jgi:hypothetical protein
MAALAGGPALAAGGTWTATPTGTYSATASKATLAAVLTLTCAKATATGDVPKSTGASGTNYVATISTASFSLGAGDGELPRWKSVGGGSCDKGISVFS